MRLHVSALGKSLSAEITRIRPLSRVTTYMCLQIASLGESSTTPGFRTSVRFLACMCPHVSFQLGLLVTSLLAALYITNIAPLTIPPRLATFIGRLFRAAGLPTQVELFFVDTRRRRVGSLPKVRIDLILIFQLDSLHHDVDVGGKFDFVGLVFGHVPVDGLGRNWRSRAKGSLGRNSRLVLNLWYRVLLHGVCLAVFPLVHSMYWLGISCRRPWRRVLLRIVLERAGQGGRSLGRIMSVYEVVIRWKLRQLGTCHRRNCIRVLHHERSRHGRSLAGCSGRWAGVVR